MVQEININRDVLLKCGMSAERMRTMEEGLNQTELLTKQRDLIRRYTDMERLKDSARSALSK